jgi:hypothetical protein
MARPKTKGDTIGVQLPLAVDTWLRDAAATAGVSPAAFIEGVVRQQRAEIARQDPGIPGQDARRLCVGPHELYYDHATGFNRCRHCPFLARMTS